MQELYAFMESANATLDASLEDDAGLLSPMASVRSSSLPPSAKATPRSLPSTEVGRGCVGRAAWGRGWLAWPVLGHQRPSPAPILTTRCCAPSHLCSRAPP